MTAHAQLQLTQEASVVMEEADIWGTCRIDITRDRGGKKSVTVNKGEIVDLARLERLKSNARLDVVTWNRHQPFDPTGHGWFCADANPGSSGRAPDAGSASATIS